MSKRVSHGLLDPFVGPCLQSLYPYLSIPKRFPPEGIVLVGHLSAIAGAIGFAFSTSTWWGGGLASAGVIGNHLADCVDGTHARRTGQCRNGGELLDHFTDPLSFAYWMIGIGVAAGSLQMALAAVVILFAIAVLTNIKAKLVGEFTLSAFGPTELKAILVGSGLTIALVHAFAPEWAVITTAIGFAALITVGAIQLPVQLYQSVRDVNQFGGQPDTSEWEVRR
ncbi:CDP-alcohol phosphatidyltransferase [Rubripirellula lacrimiformis]|uniref:CDP-alcohol phosphatidyltransferase n=1 Tax=Rubripirellula lacrimiformis TaxID=1930273 RepID=A0A517NEJ1_9BACT|nr:CDP-alcohol phosphatidyltransferase family protein [Rubripirellula lacrimiformis]QDT05547.1 CDP-alcohol phosphatidyltransferase [Rubripirellula lacrimiformis]